MAPPSPVDKTKALRLVATLHSWVRVDTVDKTGGAVIKRVLLDPKYSPDGPSVAQPPPESLCRVRSDLSAVYIGAIRQKVELINEIQTTKEMHASV